jgi:hypothetical protein
VDESKPGRLGEVVRVAGVPGRELVLARQILRRHPPEREAHHLDQMAPHDDVAALEPEPAGLVRQRVAAAALVLADEAREPGEPLRGARVEPVVAARERLAVEDLLVGRVAHEPSRRLGARQGAVLVTPRLAELCERLGADHDRRPRRRQRLAVPPTAQPEQQRADGEEVEERGAEEAPH